MPFVRISMVAMLLLSAGCGDAKKSAQPAAQEQRACEGNEDCAVGWVCLDSECTNAASGTIYTDPSNAVTPEKVKTQVDQISAERQKRADELLEGL